MRILALDPGTSTGFALAEGPSPVPLAVNSGTWELQRSGDGWGRRFVRLRDHIQQVAPNLVLYELVRGHRKGAWHAAHVYGGMLATITGWCEETGVAYEGVEIYAWKRHATGRANAPIDVYHAAAEAHFGPEVKGPDQSAALWILDYFVTQRRAT